MSLTFAVGDLTVHRVIESEGPLFDPLTFFPTLTPELLEENASWMKPHYIDPASGQLMLCIQSYIVRTPHHNILIDSCVGNHKERANYPFWNQMTSDRYEKNLAATGSDHGRHRLRHVHPSARGPCGLEHAAAERALGADLPKGQIRVRRP